jgi:hypothetical protein
MPLVLLLLSCLVLALEVLETKIFAYSLENGLIFLVVGVVLLGFGAGGSVLSLKAEMGDPRRLVGRNLLLTAALLVIAHAVFARYSDQLEFALDGWTVGILVALAAPYFSAGMAVAAILADPAGNVHARYGINLIGSALGCLVVFFVLGPLSGPRALIVCAIVCGLLAVPLLRAKVLVAVGVLALGVPLFLWADELLDYRIQKAESGGQLALIMRECETIRAREPERFPTLRMEPVFDRWDPTARVEVHDLVVETKDQAVADSLKHLPSMWFTQDSSYGSPLIGGTAPGSKGFFERTCYAFGYFRKKAAMDVLVIGLGGTPDIQTALHHDAKSITGVDINSTTMEMARGPMAEFLGRPYQDPRVKLFLSDGRSHVRASSDRWDLIQLTGVDTKSVLASGTLALNESYLYTAEAFDEYLAHLEDDGILCVNYAGDQFRERLAATALMALERRGVKEAWRNLVMLEQAKVFGLLVKPTPFTAEELSALDAFLEACDSGDGAADGRTGVTVWVYELLTQHLSMLPAPRALYLPSEAAPSDPIMAAAKKGQLAAYLANDRNDIAPAPDSRPYFFNVVRRGEIWRRFKVELANVLPFLATPADAADKVLMGRTEHFGRTFRQLFIMLGLAVLLILGPLAVMRVRGLRSWVVMPFAVYFASLGAGYIFAMSGLIQRAVLFLGHQAYAFAVVIGGLLVWAGVGSMLAGRARSMQRTMVFAVAVICAMLAVVQFGLDPLFSLTASLGLPARIGVALVAIAPLGIALGTMFPTGLALVKARSPHFVPWAFGINGVFSVIGTTLVLPGSIAFGYPAMATAAGGIYVFALLVGLPLARRLA